MDYFFSDHDIGILIFLLLGLILGAVGGIAHKFSKVVAISGAVAASYFLSTLIANAICKIEAVANWINGFDLGGVIILAATYIVVFIIALILILIIVTPLAKFLFEGGPVRKTISHLLGAVVGLFIAFLIASIYILILHGLSGVSNDVLNFVNDQFGYSTNRMTISRWMLDLALGAVGKIKEMI